MNDRLVLVDDDPGTVSAQLVLAGVKAQLCIKHLADELRRIATVDVLTGIANRRRFDELLDREWRLARRSGDALALLMIDIDHFKLFNDHYGHPAGDACLRSVAQALVGARLRPADLVARYGGEEFAVLLPLTPREGAVHVAWSVLDAVEALGIVHAASPTSRCVCVSVGISCYDGESANWIAPSADAGCASDLAAQGQPADLLRAADVALYSAKHAGRGRAMLLDIADVASPRIARDIGRPPRATPSAA